MKGQGTFTVLDDDQLLKELYGQMLVVAYSKTSDRVEALDIVQEAWVRIISRIDTLRDRDKLYQWAKTIVHHTAINVMRKRCTQQNRSCELDSMELPCSKKEPQVVVEELWIKECIMEGLSELDELTRQLMKYKYFQHYKDQEIAEMTGIPLGTVKARLHRAKERLKGVLTAKLMHSDLMH